MGLRFSQQAGFCMVSSRIFYLYNVISLLYRWEKHDIKQTSHNNI